MAEQSKRFDPEVILDAIYNGILAIDEEGVIAFLNQTAERLFEITAREALGRHILAVLPNIGNKLFESLQTGDSYFGEQLRGETVTLVANIAPLRLNGKIIGAVSVFQELSEIEKISKELDFFKNMKDWLDTVIDSSYDGLWICDHEGEVVRINKAAEKLNGVKASDVVGRNMRDIVEEGIMDKSVSLEVLKRRTTVTMIQQIKGGRKILVTSNPIFNEKGEITFVVSNDRDLTELDQLRSELEESQALAKRYSSKLSELEMKEVDLSKIVFRSEEMKRMIETAIRVSKTDSTIFLLGESGVGKGMIAKLIHKHSERKNGPFIRVDCAGIPDPLFESELFGYDKGAFTGAKSEGKPGLFELANEGTLFLDEVAEIPLNLQSKLLRFLEEHEIIRVGGTKPRQINTRVIAATNRNIEEMVSSKLFRQDLYYRLHVVPIHIPPLRKRREDILALIVHFLEKFNKACRQKRVLSPEVVEVLCHYDYPGNVRELANLLERLIVLSEKDRIEKEDLPKAVLASQKPYEESSGDLCEEIPLKRALEKYECFMIRKAMKRYRTQKEAARILKVAQATISRKMKKYLALDGYSNSDKNIH